MLVVGGGRRLGGLEIYTDQRSNLRLAFAGANLAMATVFAFFCCGTV